MGLEPISDELAADYTNAMSPLEREVMALCSRRQSWGYARLAEKTGASYAEIQFIGKCWQSSQLATVRPIKHGREFAGSAIFLTTRGEQVQKALAELLD